LVQEQFDTRLANWELFGTTLKTLLKKSPSLSSIKFNSLLSNKEKAKEILLSQMNIIELSKDSPLFFSSLQIKVVLNNIASQFIEVILLVIKANIPLRKLYSKSKL